MRQNRWVWQSIVCLAVFAAVHSGMGALTIEKYERIGELVKKITEAVQENYTLAELLELWDDASATVASIPVSVREAVISANQETLYGAPIDAPGDSESRQVYASAGGRVLKSGLQDGLGLEEDTGADDDADHHTDRRKQAVLTFQLIIHKNPSLFAKIHWVLYYTSGKRGIRQPLFQ